MATEKNLLLALEFVSEGRKAVVPAALSKETFGTESFQVAAAKLQKKARPWTRGPGIQGLGIGDKITEGKPARSLALRVYVRAKKPNAKVTNRIPKEVDIPSVGRVGTDVIEIGEVKAESFTTRARPARPGCGVGHKDVTVGTFGCLVRLKSKPTGGLYILSNSHVLANEGLGQIGDAILQPGPYDEGKPGKDVLARLAAFQPFVFSSGYDNHIDAAIAKVAASKVHKQIRILNVAPQGVSHTLRRGMRVQKVGRTTDYTMGEITDVNYRLHLSYQKPGGGTGSVGFRDQVLCTRYTAGGDSGSAVLNNSRRIVGLHFAGSPSTSIFHPIRFVFDELGIELA